MGGRRTEWKVNFWQGETRRSLSSWLRKSFVLIPRLKIFVSLNMFCLLGSKKWNCRKTRSLVILVLRILWTSCVLCVRRNLWDLFSVLRGTRTLRCWNDCLGVNTKWQIPEDLICFVWVDLVGSTCVGKKRHKYWRPLPGHRIELEPVE